MLVLLRGAGLRPACSLDVEVASVEWVLEAAWGRRQLAAHSTRTAAGARMTCCKHNVPGPIHSPCQCVPGVWGV